MVQFNEKAWKLKHQLIVESINRYHDFNLDEINAEVRRRLGEPEAVKESLTVKTELKKIWDDIDQDWAARHQKAALAVKELVKK